MTKCHPVTTPLNPNVKLNKISDDAEPALPQLVHEYSTVISSLNFATIATRPDLKYTVHELSQFMNNPLDSSQTCPLLHQRHTQLRYHLLTFQSQYS